MTLTRSVLLITGTLPTGQGECSHLHILKEVLRIKGDAMTQEILVDSGRGVCVGGGGVGRL